MTFRSLLARHAEPISAPDKPLYASAADLRRRRGRAAQGFGGGAEAAVARRYEAEGWRILARNWRAPRECGGGELDIVAHRGDVVAFVEAKSRRTLDAAAETVTPAQRRRITAAAEVFMSRVADPSLDMRFDLALSDRCGGLRILENVWLD